MDIVLFDYHFAPDTILAALVFGFLHALEPGHGKTALLAYMADGRKSYWHSVVVGFSSFFSAVFRSFFSRFFEFFFLGFFGIFFL